MAPSPFTKPEKSGILSPEASVVFCSGSESELFRLLSLPLLLLFSFILLSSMLPSGLKIGVSSPSESESEEFCEADEPPVEFSDEALQAAANGVKRMLNAKRTNIDESLEKLKD